jgi:general transcription factor 3C polypeptide 3 (transcription factor C subunit 4)
VQIGKCCIAIKMNKEAEVYFQTALEIDERNIPALMELARLYEEMNEHEEAYKVVRKILAIQEGYTERPSRRVRSFKKRKQIQESSPKLKRAYKTRSRPRRLADPEERRREEASIAGHLQDQFATVLKEREQMREGDSDSTMLWMEAAEDLIDDFRGFKLFYPWENYMRFIGYSVTSRRKAETKLEMDMTVMADRLTQRQYLAPESDFELEDNADNE